MSNLFWFSEEQFKKIQPLLPNDVRGVPRVDDRRVLSGIVHVIKHGLRWSDCPAAYGPAKTIYNRYARWGEKGVFARLFAALVAEAGTPDSLAIDSTHIKAHRTAGSGRKKGARIAATIATSCASSSRNAEPSPLSRRRKTGRFSTVTTRPSTKPAIASSASF